MFQSDDDLVFDGTSKSSALDFIQAIRRKAHENAAGLGTKTSLADLASLCFDGAALEWFENLDFEVQGDWNLLRKALIARFPTASTGKLLDSTTNVGF